MINIKAGIQHLKELTSFYKKEGENDINNCLKDDLKILNEKLMRMYDVVKNDPQYMKRNYKASANNIQNIINDHHADYVPYNKSDD